MQVLLDILSAWAGFLLTKLPAAAATFVGGWLGIRLLGAVLSRALRAARIEPTIAGLFKSAITIALWIIVIAAVLQALGLSQVALAVSGSIALVALGIASAASGTLADIIAGVFLVSDPDFRVGDTITTGGITGVIQSIDLRKARILAADGRLNVIPNQTVEKTTWVVERRREK